MRRAWLRGRKRYLIHVEGFDLGVLMHALFGCGTSREAVGTQQSFLFLIQRENAVNFFLIGQDDGQSGAMLLAISSGPP